MIGDLRATYRVQLQPDFDFVALTDVLDHLATLGISHLYLSPVTQAVPGSTHGYDVVDPTRVNEDLGGEPALRSLREAARAVGLRLLVDIVPNHQAADPRNRAWWSLLTDGRSGAGDDVFDVEWDAPDADGRVVVPLLTRSLDDELHAGTVAIVDDPELGTVARVGSLTVPIAPGSAAADADPATALAGQHYELVDWRTGNHRVNYRRFFDIASLPAVRTEQPAVFDFQHALILRLAAEGIVEGVRVDHIDGLRDPAAYLRRLRARFGGWLLVEKILGPGETLPTSLDADGTTGYEIADRATAVLVDPDGEAPLTALWTRLSGDTRTFDAVVHEARAKVVTDLFTADLDRVTRAFTRAIGALDGLRDALAAILAAMDVYRTYVAANRSASDADRARIAGAIARARARAEPSPPPPTLEVVRAVLVGEHVSHAAADARLRFQQLSAAVAAKGVEDTALYRYLRLTARNEVGADPGVFACSVEEFHAANLAAAGRDTLGLAALSTHDSKYAADVRARLAVISEVPDEWEDLVRLAEVRVRSGWRAVSRDAVAEYLVLQTVVGAWPISRARLRAYMRKAGREAKQHTSWHAPDPAYESAVDRVVDRMFDDRELRAAIERFVARVLVPGRINALAQVVIQCVVPGVPDIYQGDERWRLALVDPDNRAPLHLAPTAALLAELAGRVAPPLDVLADPNDAGRPKLWTLVHALAARRRHPDCFAPGAPYLPARAHGRAAEHVVAFGRSDGVVAVLPRLSLRLDGRWDDTTVDLEPGSWHDVMSGRMHDSGSCSLGTLLSDFPVALLERVG